MRMLFIHSYFEILDKNVKSGRFMKCGVNVSHCVMCSSSVNFQSFIEF